MKQKKDFQQGTLAMMVLQTLDVLEPRAGHKFLEAAKRDWEQRAAIIASFFEVKRRIWPMMLLCVGSVLGLLAGISASRLLGHIVYQANPRNPVVGGVVLTMALLGIAAAAIPARRALAVDPSKLMREE